MKIGIIGNGFVGKATKILKSEKVEIMVYDIIPELCEPHGLTLEKLCNETDIIFISVPTPTNKISIFSRKLTPLKPTRLKP